MWSGGFKPRPVNDMATFDITVRLAWWFDWYLKGLLLFCTLFGTTPDPARVKRMVYRAMRLQLRLLPRTD